MQFVAMGEMEKSKAKRLGPKGVNVTSAQGFTLPEAWRAGGTFEKIL